MLCASTQQQAAYVDTRAYFPWNDRRFYFQLKKATKSSKQVDLERPMFTFRPPPSMCILVDALSDVAVVDAEDVLHERTRFAITKT